MNAVLVENNINGVTLRPTTPAPNDPNNIATESEIEAEQKQLTIYATYLENKTIAIWR